MKGVNRSKQKLASLKRFADFQKMSEHHQKDQDKF